MVPLSIMPLSKWLEKTFKLKRVIWNLAGESNLRFLGSGLGAKCPNVLKQSVVVFVAFKDISRFLFLQRELFSCPKLFSTQKCRPKVPKSVPSPKYFFK